MSSTNKRKSVLSPSPKPSPPPEANSHKRRFSVQQAAQPYPPPVAAPNAYFRERFIDRVPRPARWRGPWQTASNLPTQSPAQQPPLQSIYKLLPTPKHTIKHGSQHQQQGDTEVRFSFSSSAGYGRQEVKYLSLPPACVQHPEEDINRSFENLSFDFDNGCRTVFSPPQTKPRTADQMPALPTKPQRTGYGFSYTDSLFYSDIEPSPTSQPPNSPAATHMPAMAVIPELTKPKKAGYGFSYSDSMFYDPDEYPDTECEWEPELVKEPKPMGEKARVAPSNMPSTIIRQDSSFVDVVVMRDVGSFHIAKPQKRLPCTTATREDTIQVKHAAKLLMKYEESAELCDLLMARLERMVCAVLQKPDRKGHNVAATATYCALKLRDFLVNTKQEHIETGVLQHALEHEIEWAKWLVEASCTGVMHLKVPGCNCRPGWEDD